MNHIFCALLLVMMVSCSFGQEESDYWLHYNDWLCREDFSKIYEDADLGFKTNFLAFDTYDWIHKNIKYEADIVPYWSSSHETLEKGYGDCEDKAILMYVLLLNQGVPADDMDLVIVELSNGKRHCMVRVLNNFYFYMEGKELYRFGIDYFIKTK